MSNELPEPEHKLLANDLRLAKAKRVKLEAEMFAVSKPQNCVGVQTTPQWLKAVDAERALASQLAQLRSDAQDELAALAQAAHAGAKLDRRRAEHLSTVIVESWNDLMSV
jgi:hypothetical protein